MTLLAENEGAPIAAIVVTYNSADALPSLLRSLVASTAAVHAIVVDNGSRDDTVAVARSFDGVTVVETHANLGYSGGINVGRRALAAGQAVAVLNPDLVVEPDALERLLETLDEPRVGIAAPRLHEAGERFDSLWREPSLLGSLGDALFGSRWPCRPVALSDTLRRDEHYARPRDVAWASGAALMISAACNARTGEWDAARYFLYSEETDYARRARDLGFLVRSQPRARAHHVGGASGRSPALAALATVNRLRYFRAHHGPIASAVFRLVLLLEQALRSFRPDQRAGLTALLSARRRELLPHASGPEPTAEAVQ